MSGLWSHETSQALNSKTKKAPKSRHPKSEALKTPMSWCDPAPIPLPRPPKVGKIMAQNLKRPLFYILLVSR